MDKSTDFMTVVTSHPWAIATMLGAIALIIIAVVLRRPLTRFLDSFSRQGGKLGPVELNPEPAHAQQPALAPTPPATTGAQLFDTVTQTLIGPVIDDRARMIEADLMKLQPHEDKHKALLILAARDQTLVEFYRIYLTIYASQIGLLKGLNMSRGAPRSHVEEFYKLPLSRDPEFYRTYSIDMWLNYLLSNGLIRVDGDIYQVTHRGQLFLVFIVRDQLSDAGLPHNSKR